MLLTILRKTWHRLFFVMLVSFYHLSTSAQKKSYKAIRPVFAPQLPANKYAEIDRRVSLIPADSAVSADVLARYVKSHFSTDEEQVRAIYWWLVQNISYDVENMYSFNIASDVQQSVQDLYTRRKAICQGYALTFTTLCQQLGIKSYVIGGYTIQGRSIAALSHAWNAAQINGRWYLFDTTWGTGSIINGQFERQPNDVFFMVEPVGFIHTHVPFDPLWQFLEHPISHNDVMGRKAREETVTSYFNYQDSLRTYTAQSELAQREAEAHRIERSGVRNDLTYNYLDILKRNIVITKDNMLADQYNSGLKIYNHLVALYTEFITYRNNQFKPEKPETEVRAKLDSVAAGITHVRQIVDNLRTADQRNLKATEQLEVALADVDRKLTEQQAFVDKYYSTRKIFRKFLFLEVKK